MEAETDGGVSVYGKIFLVADIDSLYLPLFTCHFSLMSFYGRSFSYQEAVWFSLRVDERLLSYH